MHYLFQLQVAERLPMSESALWAWLRPHVSQPPRYRWERIENGAGMGTPDLHYCVAGRAGWIELKEILRWPTRSATVVPVDHWTREQRLWHWEYAAAGGVSWVLLRVLEARTLLFWRGYVASEVIGHGTQRELIMSAALVHPNYLTGKTMWFVQRLYALLLEGDHVQQLSHGRLAGDAHAGGQSDLGRGE